MIGSPAFPAPAMKYSKILHGPLLAVLLVFCTAFAQPNFPATLGDPPADFREMVRKTIPASRDAEHEVSWTTFTPDTGLKPRLPAWFQCVVKNGPKVSSRGKFTLYDVGAQGRRYVVMIRFHNPAQIVSFKLNNTPVPLDTTDPSSGFYRVETMQWGGNRNTYKVEFTGPQCAFDAIYADWPPGIVAKDGTGRLVQPDDGSPPPGSSGEEH